MTIQGSITSEMKTVPPGGGGTAQRTKGIFDTPVWTAQNPFDNDLAIFSPFGLEGQKVTFTIVNMQGRIELENEKFISEPIVSINSSGLSTGNYILQIRTENNVQCIKIQKM